ncbi:MAG TPA: hypothetical protein VE866_14075, partial [Candidatus Binatia bacterium]|nr:hypothetical protein [Candidatus Binatia bacterium]
AGHLPNFKSMRDQSEVCLSLAEEKPPHLDPWIQWVNVHTGVPYAQHGISDLSQGHNLRYKSVWNVVSDAGWPVWVCGSMNVQYGEGIQGYILPDPWATDLPPYPDKLKPYFHFIQQNVLEYNNKRVPLTKSDYLNFMTFMLRHGLSFATVDAAVRQLLSEKRTGCGRWRRAFIMDKLQFDMFGAIYRRLKPRFATFFLNSTAHMQHSYWRNMEPELFTVAPSSEEQRQYDSAILQGYQQMDGLLGRLLKMVGNQAIVILATALSQQPCLAYEGSGGKHCYFVSDYARLMAFAGLTFSYRCAPVMAGQFWIHLDNSSEAEEVQSRLRALHLAEKPVIDTRREGSSVFASCPITQAIDSDAVVRIEGSEQAAPFFSLFYSSGIMKSGMHHPDGILWIRHSHQRHSVREKRVPLTSIAPTILDFLGLPKPPEMSGESILKTASESTLTAA